MTHLSIIRQAILWAASLFITSAAQAQIVFADYSDPDVCEGTDGDYWLTASSFQCTPGLPILHSTDMAEWTLVGYALDNIVPRERYDTVQHGEECGHRASAAMAIHIISSGATPTMASTWSRLITLLADGTSLCLSLRARDLLIPVHCGTKTGCGGR